MSRPVIFLAIFILAGCSLPQWRVGQAKIDPKLAEKPKPTMEAERRAAALIVDLSAAPTANPVGRIAEIHAVAVPLSASLGEPLKRATVFEVPNVVADTRAGLLAAQAREEKWKAFARKYAGKEIEDTGVNLAGPAGLLGLVAVVAACVMCPALGWALLRLLPVLWSALKRAAGLVEAVAQRAPDVVAQLKSNLPQREDAARQLVRLAKRRAP